jgi:putative Holliday junction resolvase
MRCLALDVGEKRTGVALGEVLARPLTTLQRRSKAQDFRAIADLVRRHQVDTLVVGLPLNMDDTCGFQAQRISRYANRMKEALAKMGLDIELVLWDERLSTERAGELLAEHGHAPHDRRRRIDAAAAAVILQDYLDRQVEQ